MSAVSDAKLDFEATHFLQEKREGLRCDSLMQVDLPGEATRYYTRAAWEDAWPERGVHGAFLVEGQLESFDIVPLN